MPTLTALVKSQCRAIDLTENYGTHTLRKTFVYQQRVKFGFGTAELMWIFNHDPGKANPCLPEEQVEIRDVY